MVNLPKAKVQISVQDDKVVRTDPVTWYTVEYNAKIKIIVIKSLREP